MKTLTNAKDCSESSIRISVPAYLSCLWSVFSGLRYMSFPEQLTRVTSGYLKSGTSILKRVSGLLEEFSVSYFIEASRTFIFDFLHNKAVNTFGKPSALIKKYCFLGPFKKILLVRLSLFNHICVGDRPRSDADPDPAFKAWPTQNNMTAVSLWQF
jgi:hypothetical protein